MIEVILEIEKQQQVTESEKKTISLSMIARNFAWVLTWWCQYHR